MVVVHTRPLQWVDIDRVDRRKGNDVCESSHPMTNVHSRHGIYTLFFGRASRHPNCPQRRRTITIQMDVYILYINICI